MATIFSTGFSENGYCRRGGGGESDSQLLQNIHSVIGMSSV